MKRGEVLACARQVRFLLLDVDGVLTDGRVYLLPDGQEAKVFDIRDGQGITLLQRQGIPVGILSARSSRAVEVRAKELGIDDVQQGVLDKLEGLKLLIRHRGLDARNIAYVGDDLGDLPVLRAVGLGIAPADAAAEVRKAAAWTAPYPGGRGAVRAACELILKAQRKWPY